VIAYHSGQIVDNTSQGVAGMRRGGQLGRRVLASGERRHLKNNKKSTIEASILLKKHDVFEIKPAST
jgi:hypothetical protein